MQIDQINDNFNVSYFEHIDRIINAGRISEMQELKKLVKFIDHLIQSLIHQIVGGTLTEKGAKIKILHLFGIIQHCQIGNHPTIKSQLDKLKRLYENNFKPSSNKAWLNFKPKALILTGDSVQHYVESIQDSQNDPIYSEQPKNLIEDAEKALKKVPDSKNNIELSQYYLSNLIGQKSIYKKLKKYIEAAQSKSKVETTPTPPIEEKQKKKIHHIDFNELSKAYQQTIIATA